MSQEVIDAMNEVAKAFVEIDELQKKAGMVIAEITGAEVAYVTSGASAALVLAVAACMKRKAKVEQKKYIGGSDHYLCWAELDITKL